MISSILTYNSEAWGVFTKSEFKYWDTSPIEKSHLQFCKRYLQVNVQDKKSVERDLKFFKTVELFHLHLVSIVCIVHLKLSLAMLFFNYA